MRKLALRRTFQSSNRAMCGAHKHTQTRKSVSKLEQVRWRLLAATRWGPSCSAQRGNDTEHFFSLPLSLSFSPFLALNPSASPSLIK